MVAQKGRSSRQWSSQSGTRLPLKFLKRIIKGYGRPRLVVTDALRAYSNAKDDIGAADRHQVGHRLNNRAENSHHAAAALSRFEVITASKTSPL
jgi:transposase-like protein